MADKTRKPQQNPAKRPFENPAFKDLGSLSELTKGPTGGAIDGVFGGIGGFQSPPTT